MGRIKGIKLTDTHKTNIANSMRQWHSEHRHPLQGKEVSMETKEKISLSQRGSGNGNWKGGLTEIVRGIRRSPELHQWRKAILERDRHTCQDCGAKTNLAVHHIKSVLEYPLLIFALDNGLTLCKNCHKRHTSWLWLKLKRRK